MSGDQEYRVLARFLVQTLGAGALDCARRFSEQSRDQEGEAVKTWRNVALVIERIIARKERRRYSDYATY